MKGCEYNDLAITLFKAVQAGIIIIDADTKIVIDINPAACVMIGIEREKVIGGLCSDQLCVENCEGCPVLTTELKYGEEVVENKEVLLRRKDGSVVFAWLSINSAVFGDRRLFINTLVDISKQKEAEYKLAEHWASAEKMLTDNIIQLKNGVV